MKAKYLKDLILPFFIALVTYFGQSEYLLNNIQSKWFTFINVNDIPIIKDKFLMIGIACTTIPLAKKIISLELKNEGYTNQNEFLIRYVKQMFLTALESKILNENSGLKIRIFVPLKVNIITKLIKVIKKENNKVIFKIKFIEGLSDNEISENLQFEVCPKKQGLIGVCYEKKAIVYEQNLIESKENFNLDDNQKSITCGTRFCVCIPIFNSKSNVVAVMTMDSTKEIIIPKENQNDVYNIMYNFSKNFNEQIPDFFK